LADREGGYAGREPDAVTELFGGGRGDEEGDQSPLFVFDSFGELPQGTATEIRDGVALEGATGTAEDHKKFDAEVLPAGTRFPIRLDLVVSQDHSEHMLLESLAR